MSRKGSLVLNGIGILLLVAVLSLFVSSPAQAQTQTPPAGAACIACHENRYFLHDTGKWYCLCSSPVRCIHCHGGNPQAVSEEAAHAGLVANPVKDNAAICQSCHPEDYSARVEKFALVAGIQTPHATLPTPEQPGLLSAQTGNGSLSLLLTPGPVSPLQVAGWVTFIMAALGLFVFTCRCWRVDHAS
jgi:hypothetical protein